MRIPILFVFLFVCLFGCQEQRDTQQWFADNGKVKVLCTTGMICDLVERVGGDRVDSHALIVGQVDPHSYEIVKGDDEKIAFAHLVVCNGLNLEHGASLRALLEGHQNAVFLGSEIQKKAPARILEVGGEIDPHLWMDISLWAEGVSTIADALTQLDPEGAAFYRARAKEVEQTLQHEHITLQQLMRTVPEDRRYLVTSHDAFHYFARAYLSDGNDWKERCIAPEGLAPEGQLSPQDIRRVAEHLDKYRIQVVFPESNVNQDSLKKVISCCPHKVRCSEITLYGDAMGPGSYLEMIRHNVEALAQEWEQ